MIIFTKKNTIVLLLAAFAQFAMAQVKVGENPTIINKGSILELESTNKGLLFPRVSLTNSTTWSLATSSIPIAGMMVYNTRTTVLGFTGTTAYPAATGDGTGIYYWDGIGWVAAKGTSGKGISSTVNNNNGTYTFNYTDGTSFTTGSLKGDKGDAGVVGTNGIDGKSIASGTGVPTGGNSGDTYVDTSTGDVYTNTGGVWAVTGNLKGATGAAGADGKSVTSGSTNPVDGVGNTGDTYINTVTGDTYTYNGTTWTQDGNIKGATGAAGADGKSVASGSTNPVDGVGNNGDTYINTTTGDTYTYNGTTWTQDGNIKGATGPQGATGAIGADGKSVASGSADPVDGVGNNGDTYINTTTGDTYTYNGTTWTQDGNIKGATGATGPQGNPGTPGIQGIQGPQGDPGATGTTDAVTADNGLIKTTDNIQLGGALIEPTTITADATNTLAVAGLQTGVATDKLVVADLTTGVLKSIDQSTLTVEPWNVQTTTDKATDNTQNIYQIGSVAIGKNAVQTGAMFDVAGAIRGGIANTTASIGVNSIAVGEEVIASGKYATAFGFQSEASGTGAFAGGGEYKDNPFGPPIIRKGGTASRINSFAFGSETEATGNYSVAMGFQSHATQTGAVAIGYSALAEGQSATAFGRQTRANSLNETVMGSRNAIETSSATAFVLTDPILQVGVGSATYTNALTILKNGNMGIGIAGQNDTAKPTERLDIGSGGVKIRGINSGAYIGSATTDRMVVADATGVLKTIAITNTSVSNIIKITSDYTALATDYTILANATGAGFTITLPGAAASIGRILVIRKTDETANVLTFNAPIKTSETTSFSTLNTNATIRIQSDGTDWYKID